MSEPPKRNHSLFDHPAFEYQNVRGRELNIKPTWLPYYERLGLVLWLYAVAMLSQALIGMPYSSFTRLVISSLGVWWALLGMGVALRRANYHIAVTYQERTNRRWKTFMACTIGMMVWVGVVYITTG